MAARSTLTALEAGRSVVSQSEVAAGGVLHGFGRADVSLDEGGEPLVPGLGGDPVQGDAGDSGAGGVPGAQRVGGDRPVAVHQPTIDYAARRTAEGLFKRDIIRCLKRYLAREIYQAVMADHRAREGTATEGAPTKS